MVFDLFIGTEWSNREERGSDGMIETCHPKRLAGILRIGAMRWDGSTYPKHTFTFKYVLRIYLTEKECSQDEKYRSLHNNYSICLASLASASGYQPLPMLYPLPTTLAGLPTIRRFSPSAEKSPESLLQQDTTDPFGRIVPLPIVQRLPIKTLSPIRTGICRGCT